MVDFNTAKNLDELLEMLNNNEISEGVLCELPTFGSEIPDDIICDVYSWDETRYLIENTCTSDNKFELVARY